RRLKAGLAVLLAVAGIMTVVYFRLSRRATRETQRTYAVIARLNRDLTGQEDLIAETRKMSEQMQRPSADAEQAKQLQLERQSHALAGRKWAGILGACAGNGLPRGHRRRPHQPSRGRAVVEQ